MGIQARIMRRYDRLARLYELVDRPRKDRIRKGKRERLGALTRGHVLEVGGALAATLPVIRSGESNWWALISRP